jgi:hypothetical protein
MPHVGAALFTHFLLREGSNTTQSLSAISIELFTTTTLETESREIKTESLVLDPTSVHQSV